MAEIVLAFLPTIAEYTIAPVVRWLCYSFHYNSNIENLNDQKEKLQDAKTRLQHSIDEAVRNGDEIEDDVTAWLRKADEIIESTLRILGESEVEAGTRCSIVTCLNLKRRHQLSREAKKIEETIVEHLKNGKFEKVAYRPAPDGMVITRNMDYMAMDSRMTAMNGIMKALESVDRIGVWGMPGVGKSTLMEELIARQAKDDKKLFSEVVKAVVTESPDVRRIQGEIADMLGLKFDQESVEGRASHLQRRLSKGKKILVILDDIWKELNLREIGIPSEGCKLVMTSRNKDVLICGMGAQIDIELTTLQEKEAWNFFEKMAGESVKDPNVRDIATEVAKECAGLPIALATVSKALKNKRSSEWRYALSRLKTPAPQHMTGMLKTIYSPIELSYNKLETQELKSLFLLCAQLTHFIHYRDLLIYSYGNALFQGINNTLEEARDILDTLLRQLKDSSLLLESSNGFHLHDLVRDVATIIASKDHNMLVMSDEGGLKEWPNADSLKRCEAFAILGGNIDQLPNKMECPELRFFYIYYKIQSLKIPDTLFQGMDKLKVLDLEKMPLSSLPSSLLLSKNLQTLCLDGCELEDIFGIGELKNLVILSLRDSKISELPKEVGSLIGLRMLDLSNCNTLETFPLNVLSSLVKLQELYLGSRFAEWEADQGLNDEREYANLAELKHMSRLTTLETEIPDANNLPKASMFQELERYTIFIGGCDGGGWGWGWGWCCNESAQFSRTLKLKLNSSFQLEVWIKMLLKRTEDLQLAESNGVKSVIPEMDGEGFQQLKHLEIQNNSEIKHIVNLSTSIIAFPILEKFVVESVINLEEICCGKLSPGSFRNLRVLKVRECWKLKFVFSSSIARELSLLEVLKVRECHNMLAIVVIEEEEEVGIKDGDMSLFCKLKKLVLKDLPELVSFLSTKNSIVTDVHMTLLHHQVVAFPSLEILHICGLPKIQHVWTECSETNFTFQNLKELRIHDCGVEEIIAVEGGGGGAGEAVARFVFPRVTHLELTNLRRLKWFYKGVHVSKWPMLKCIEIDGCEQIEKLVSGIPVSFEEIVGENIKQPLFLVDELSFPSLEILEIESMKKLEMIWQDQVAISSFPNIKTLNIYSCEKLETIFGKLEGPNGSETPLALIAPESRTKESVVIEDGGTRHLVSTVAHLNFEKWESKDPNTIFRFQNLQEIEVYGCYSLRCIFPTSAITCLKQLKRLEIKDCGMEEIVAVEGEGEEAVARFVFPQVTKLSLERLDRLKWFYKGVHVSKWPKLKEMKITKCHEVEILFAYGVVRFQETVGEKGSEMPIKQPLFLVDHDQLPFPSLKTLYIQDMDKLEIICQDQVAEMSFSNLQKLRIFGCQQLRLPIFQSNILTARLIPTELRLENRQSLETIFGKHEGQNGKETQALQSTFPNVEVLSLGFKFEAIWPIKFSYIPPSFLTRMPNLLELRVNDIGWEEIFPNELPDREIQVLILPRLRRLELSRLPMLTHLWKEDTQPCPLFDNLEFLSLSQCTKLRNLVPSSVFLGNLTDLRISNCHGLINLVTPSTARGLSQLKQMSVTKCKRITEIVAMEDGEAKFLSIYFHKLEYLELEGLPNLTKFYSGRYFLFFPSLEKVIVSSCPEMKTFCQYAFDSLWWGHDLNITTHWLWELDHYDTGWLFRQSVENTKEDEDP